MILSPIHKYSCSSWNYGGYSASNPCYFASKQKTNNFYFQSPTNKNNNINLYNRYGKRRLREEERIVTDEYLQNINHMKKMSKSKDCFRPKSVRGIRKPTSPPPETIKTDISNYKFRLTYDEWMEVKNKQNDIVNKIKKLKQEEDEKMEKINKKVDKKYNEIKTKKYQEWLENKNREFRLKKRLKEQEEILKEEQRKEKDIERQEKMNEWFKRQAIKMEKELIEKEEELKIQKEKEKMEKEEKMMKKKESKIRFKEWKERKDEELKEKKREQLKKEYETKSKSKTSYLNRINNKGFTIGPYTDAGALKEIQRFVNEKCTEEEGDDSGIIDEENLTPEQLEELKKLQKLQMNNQVHEDGEHEDESV